MDAKEIALVQGKVVVMIVAMVVARTHVQETVMEHVKEIVRAIALSNAMVVQDINKHFKIFRGNILYQLL
ncbi:hypothetical protein QUW50_01840 [Barnesiella viscericola]|uniref:hypothetical protein n=1 Tax=Barnesiella viscericola TaxID=397865 RepID=UPI0025A3F19D|nr:hypothetical protein [Barnesiella viscericola]MDM8267772.1 hypothetical protein [Barnesiella viscericola]